MNALRLWWQVYTSSGTMAIVLVLWLCSLAAIALVVTPWFGPWVAGIVALGLLLILLAICWGICVIELVKKANNS